MRLTFLLIILLSVFLTAPAQESATETLTNKDVVAMQKAGLSEGVIVTKIRASKTNFDTSVSALQELKKEGVTDGVILAMMNVATGLPAATPAPLPTRTPAELKFPPRGAYKHKKDIKSDYDGYKDRTQVSLSMLQVGANWSESISLAASYLYPGRTPAVPENVVLWIYSSSKDWRFLRNREVIVIADGERMDFGEADRVKSDIQRGRVSEVIGVSVPLAAFLKMANASYLQMRVGAYELQFAPDHYEAFKDFASRMSPQ